ncbi:hypothetical protein J7I93_21630 [Bacillus sp. ISL-47]|uniref:hypothetical protein n=1 Tax=Bacillus sp. ISL-47 TaxID=2819130 RepID=UPI001BEB1004|nr:hypothetical protein [Bacillus sp. ISL-47]MBT2690745.1 hypothetical protein [Bacillus sp. ISL-47]MBT2709689.1 hypothetical protein [Pseudomonas sp. ISL-84]
MFRFEDFMVAELKQKEIERIARDAWKFSSPLKEKPARQNPTKQELSGCGCNPCETC